MQRRLCTALTAPIPFATVVLPRLAMGYSVPMHKSRHPRNRPRDTAITRVGRKECTAQTVPTLPEDKTEQLQDFLIDLAEALDHDERAALSGELLSSTEALEPTRSVKEVLGHVTHSQKVLAGLSADGLALMLEEEEPTSPAMRDSAESPATSTALTVTESLLQRIDGVTGAPLADRLVLLMQLCACSPQLPRGFSLAAQELLHGTDLKAILPTGHLSRLYLKEVQLVHIDSTAVRWDGVTARRCRFDQSIFYQAHFRNCAFYHCSFDGCVLKKLRLSGNVRFIDCSFAFANLAMSADPDATVLFKKCDLDLADFTGCSGLSTPSSFVSCTNMKTAAAFPLRAR